MVKKAIKKIFIITSLIISTSLFCYAHSGGTDANGGHYDKSTGKYHYHHGYSAHPHIRGYCPYEDSYDKWLPNSCPKCNEKINFENGFCCFECGYDLTTPYEVTLLGNVDGPISKTRNEYFNEVRQLEEKIQTKNNIIETYKKDISEYKKEIMNFNEQISSFEKERAFYIIFIIIIIFILIYFIKKSQKSS